MRAALLAWLSLTISVHAQTLEQREKLNQFDKAIDAVNNLAKTTQKLADQKKQQCLIAVANEKLCECFSQNLPVIVDFRQYVAVVTHTKEELEYDKLAPDEKKVVDNVRAARDKCIKR